MKTSTTEVRCDACEQPVPARHPSAIFLTLRGPQVGHKKGDFCDAICLAKWATVFALAGGALKRPPSAEDCERCDGVGWYEGGAAIKTPCERCHGTGMVGAARGDTTP